jgi:hypothetical protein
MTLKQSFLDLIYWLNAEAGLALAAIDLFIQRLGRRRLSPKQGEDEEDDFDDDYIDEDDPKLDEDFED